jgi:hypothetical protein
MWRQQEESGDCEEMQTIQLFEGIVHLAEAKGPGTGARTSQPTPAEAKNDEEGQALPYLRLGKHAKSCLSFPQSAPTPIIRRCRNKIAKQPPPRYKPWRAAQGHPPPIGPRRR